MHDHGPSPEARFDYHSLDGMRRLALEDAWRSLYLSQKLRIRHRTEAPKRAPGSQEPHRKRPRTAP